MTESALITELDGFLGRDGLIRGHDIGARYEVDFGGENPHMPAAVMRPKCSDFFYDLLLGL